MSLSQHRVSSSKTIRPRAPCGARCIGHAVSTWSAVCSEAPHSQFGEGARPHLCMDEWNCPTPICRQLNLSQAAQGKPIPTGLAPVLGTKAHCRLKGIHSRSDLSRTRAEGLSFYYPRLLHCLNQMLAVVLLSQHRVSSSKTVRPCVRCGAQCIGHAVSTWSAVCSEAPHSQFGEGAIPHLCMDEWNCPTPICRQLSLSQAVQGKPIPTGLAPVLGTKAQSLDAFSQYSVFHL